MTTEHLPAVTPEPGPVKQFLSDLVLLLTEPVRFFKERFDAYSLSRALVFGIVVNWFASGFEWLTRLLKNESLLDGIQRVMRQLETLPFWNRLPDTLWNQRAETSTIPAWLAELSGFALSPFQSLLHFTLSGLSLFVGAWLLIRHRNKGEDPVELPVFVRVVAFSSAPNLIASWLGFLPVGIGGFIGWVYSAALLVLGLKVRFRISGLRAIVLLVLPGLLGLLALGCLLAGLVGIGFGLLAALFGTH
jgi:hypothetical protein